MDVLGLFELEKFYDFYCAVCHSDFVLYLITNMYLSWWEPDHVNIRNINQYILPNYNVACALRSSALQQ